MILRSLQFKYVFGNTHLKSQWCLNHWVPSWENQIADCPQLNDSMMIPVHLMMSKLHKKWMDKQNDKRMKASKWCEIKRQRHFIIHKQIFNIMNSWEKLIWASTDFLKKKCKRWNKKIMISLEGNLQIISNRKENIKIRAS